MFDFNSYERFLLDLQVQFGVSPEPSLERLTTVAMGLSTEANEVLDHVYKFHRDGKELDQDAIAKELGDTLVMLILVADQLGFSLEDIASINYQKLSQRSAKGTLQGSGDDR